MAVPPWSPLPTLLAPFPGPSPWKTLAPGPAVGSPRPADPSWCPWDEGSHLVVGDGEGPEGEGAAHPMWPLHLQPGVWHLCEGG